MILTKDLDYVDDIALISSTWAHTNEIRKTRREFVGTGLKINRDKTKVLSRLTATSQDPLKINGADFEDTKSFV